MNASLKIAKPDETEITVTLTMPLSDWKRLRNQLEASPVFTAYPSWKMIEVIRDLVLHAETTFTASVTEES